MLDVGTGTGLFAEGFAKLGIAVTGIDVDLELLATARKHVPTGVVRPWTSTKTRDRCGIS